MALTLSLIIPVMAVSSMADAGIVSGVGDGKFEPNRPMTAGELVTVHWNMMYGDWCKATELYNTFSNGCRHYDGDFLSPDHEGPVYSNWGVPAVERSGSAPSLHATTWDGPVSLIIYGGSRIDPANEGMPSKAVVYSNQLNGIGYGRAAGNLYSTSDTCPLQNSN